MVAGSLIVLTFVGGVILNFAGRITEHNAREHAYFVIASCAEDNGVPIDWQIGKGFHFEVEVRYFFAESAAEIAAVNCIRELAPDHFERERFVRQCDNSEASLALRRMIRGQNYAPPAERITFQYIECADAGAELF